MIKIVKLLVIFNLFAISVFATSIDINRASVKELIALKGIGHKKALAIVKYRDKVKCFKKIDDLLNIKGIGKKTIKKNSSLIKLGKCK